MKLLLSILLAAALAGCAHLSENLPYSENLSPEDGQLKVMSYNVLLGLDNSDRRETFVRYLKMESPDVLALQELNKISPGELQNLATEYGHSYSVLLKRTGYPVGITSRYPIESVRKLRAGLHHGALHVRTGGIDYIVVHFSPLSEKKRNLEAERIMAYITKNGLFPQNKVIILGDFNARSLYDFDEFENRVATPLPDLETLPENLQCLATFYRAGFTDAYAALHKREADVSTWPVNGKSEGERIDFILVSPELSDQLSGSEIPRNDWTEVISDHFPVIAQFRNK